MKYGIMFSSAGFGELRLNEIKFECKVASELLSNRLDVHDFLYPNAKNIFGDITENDNYNQFKKYFIDEECELLIATPPCQGFSLIGKNKNNNQMLGDERNFLIFTVVKFLHEVQPKYCLIENVPQFLKMKYPYKNTMMYIEEILKFEFGDKYRIEVDMYNSLKFGIAQSRNRAFIRIFKKGCEWNDPVLSDSTITMKEAIGHLPSIESGETTQFKWHFGRKHSDNHILCMRHTPTGKTALDNEIHFPKNKKGDKVKAYKASYRRLSWDKPCPTITMRNDAISSQTNVHPGRKLKDGTYSDARVLSIRELFILSSIPEDLELPTNLSEIQIRHLVGEGVPPKMMMEILRGISND